MKPYQVIGWTLLNTTAITSITSSIWHGLRPIGSAVPCINYYELSPARRNNGIGSVTFSINCRSTTADLARNLAEIVIDTFCGTSGTGMYGVQNNSFEITKSSLSNDGGLIPEPENEIYNCPIDIRIVYPVSTVS